METLSSEARPQGRVARLTVALRRAAPFTTAALVLALGYLGWEMASRRAGDRRAEDRARARQEAAYRGFENYGGSELKVLQFYASPAIVEEGSKAILCYGVANAKSVRVEPGVEPLDPSPNRCVDIRPEETTRYTLTAEGDGGKNVTESFVLQVKPDVEKLPRILSFTRGRKQREGDRTIYTLCFDTRNGSEVRVEPRAFPPGPILQGCFYAAVKETTTYKLTVTDAKGRKAERELRVEAP